MCYGDNVGPVNSLPFYRVRTETKTVQVCVRLCMRDFAEGRSEIRCVDTYACVSLCPIRVQKNKTQLRTESFFCLLKFVTLF